MVGDDRSVARQLREVRAKMRRNGRYARTLTLKAISQKDDRYPESGENWIGRGGRYSSFYRSTLKVFPRLNSSLDPCPELCRCRRCKTQLFKRAGAAKSVARCSVERTLANPGSLMELVGKEGEKMERRKGICFFFPRWHTRIDRGIDRSIDRSSCTTDPENCVTSFHFLLERRLSTRLIACSISSRIPVLRCNCLGNAINVTRCRKLSPLSLRVLSRYASPNENNFPVSATSYILNKHIYTRFVRIHVNV